MTARGIAERMIAKHGEPSARIKVTERLDRAMAAPSPLAANWLPWAAVGAALVLQEVRK